MKYKAFISGVSAAVAGAALYTSVSVAAGLPLSGTDQLIVSDVALTQVDPTITPVKTVSVSMKFDNSNMLDIGETILVRVKSASGIELGSAQFTSSQSASLVSCACWDIRVNADVTDNPYNVEFEALAGSMSVLEASASSMTMSANEVEVTSPLPIEEKGDETPPPVDGAITWDETPIFVSGNSERFQGLFASIQPYIPPNWTVAPGSFGDGQIPVTYQLPTNRQPGDALRLYVQLYGDGGQDNYCAGFGTTPIGSISVRQCNTEYPARNDYVGSSVCGVPQSWWTYYGGSTGPDNATNSAGERMSEMVRQIQTREAAYLDQRKGVWLVGNSYGGTGVSSQAMLPSSIHDEIVVVYSLVGGLNIPKLMYPSNDSIQCGFGNASLDAIDPDIQFPAGRVDNIYWYTQNGTLDTVVPFDIQHYLRCEENKVGCTGVWLASDHGQAGVGQEDGISIPLPPNGMQIWADPATTVDLDTPFPVFTSFSENTALTEPRGHHNLGLSWNHSGVVDTTQTLTVPIKYYAYKDMSDDQANKPVPDMNDTATVSVTPRRVKYFSTPPSTTVAWTFGNQSGTATADSEGLITANITVESSDSTTSADHVSLVFTKQAGETDYGVVYTRVVKSTTPPSQYPTVPNEANFQHVTDVGNIDKNYNESDVVYDDLNGNVRVLYNCATSEEICAAHEPSVSPDGTKVAYSVTYAANMESQILNGGYNPALGDVKNIRDPIRSVIYIYDIAQDSTVAFPNAGDFHDRMPDWINNDEIVFASDRQGVYPPADAVPMHRGKTQDGADYSAARSQEFANTKSLQVHRANIDGTGIKNLTPHEPIALAPYVLSNGDIVYSCWQAREDKIWKSNPAATDTRANMWWLCRVNQNGGDQTALLNGHKSNADIPLYNSDGTPSTPDELIAIRAVAEDTDGSLFITNYYRRNNYGLGSIHHFSYENPRVEGCRTPWCSDTGSLGKGRFYPSTGRVYNTYSKAGDLEASRGNRPQDLDSQSGNYKMMGKGGYTALLPGGDKLITQANGVCYAGNLPPERNQFAYTGNMPICDLGLYVAPGEFDTIPNPFSGEYLELLIDSPSYWELDAEPVTTYQSLYGQSMPTQQAPITPTGECYLNVVNINNAEVFSTYTLAEETAANKYWRCKSQGCKSGARSEAEIASLAIHTIQQWDTSPQADQGGAQNYNGTTGDWGTFLGEQAPEADGSVRMRVPCETPFKMSGNDSEGRMIFNDSILHSLRDGEERTCHGCHDAHSEERYEELGKVSSESRFAGTIAAGTNPSIPTVNEETNFVDHVEPIIQNRCVSCHIDWDNADGFLWDNITSDYKQTFPESPAIVGHSTRSLLQQIYIKDGGTGYSDGDAINVGGTGTSSVASVSGVDEVGAITAISISVKGSGFEPAWESTVTGTGTGAVLQGRSEALWINRPWTSKWITRFSSESLFYWKCIGERTDGMQDSDKSWDIDFGAAHTSGATVEECKTIARWIDNGVLEKGKQ